MDCRRGGGHGLMDEVEVGVVDEVVVDKVGVVKEVGVGRGRGRGGSWTR